jgi:hypothetical protein
MISALFSRRLAFAAVLAASMCLAGCGGKSGSGGGSSTVRTINLTSDLTRADVLVGGNLQFPSVAADTLSGTVTVDANTYAIDVKNVAADGGAALFTGSYSLSKDQYYTAVVWGRVASLRVSTLGESEDSTGISSGNTRIRSFNATIDSGTVDVYITLAGVNLNDVAPTQSTLTTGTLAGFREITAGTYRIRVTGSGDPSDVRLDIPAVTLTEKQFFTLVLTQSGSGGVLLNGTVIAQQADKSTFNNTKARVRLAASVAGGGVVSASIGGNSVFSNYRSPRVLGTGGYALVDSGTVNVNVGVAFDGVAGTATISNQSRTLVAGSDYTLLAWGTGAAPQLTLLTDDNRLPATTTRAKLRLVNGLSTSDLVSVLLDSQTFSQTSDIPGGIGSTYASVTAAGTSNLQVTSAQKSDPLYSQTVATSSTTSLLQPSGVYTMFILDGGTLPAGRLTRDR